MNGNVATDKTVENATSCAPYVPSRPILATISGVEAAVEQEAEMTAATPASFHISEIFPIRNTHMSPSIAKGNTKFRSKAVLYKDPSFNIFVMHKSDKKAPVINMDKGVFKADIIETVCLKIPRIGICKK